MATDAENALQSPQGDQTVKEGVPIPGLSNVKSGEPTGIFGI